MKLVKTIDSSITNEPRGTFVLGIDVSINHGAFVTLLDGRLFQYRFVTDRKKIADQMRIHATYLEASRAKDAGRRSLLRLDFWERYFPKVIVPLQQYVGLEDYAYRAIQGSHQLGEVGGMVRLWLWRIGCNIRLHDPASVKAYTAHDGTADKGLMIESVNARWPETRLFFRCSELRGRQAPEEEDLCDAYAIAQMVWAEVRLRRGELALSDLPEKEIQVFNRCTKRWPVSILGREWLRRRVGDGDGVSKQNQSTAAKAR